MAKALKEIGFDQYAQAEQTGWVLYLEGSTDLAILRAFAKTLGHEASRLLERPFVHYVANQPPKAESHFYGLREARPDLVGFALYDRLDRPPEPRPGLRSHAWARYEIESYLADPATLEDFAETLAAAGDFGPLFDAPEQARLRATMRQAICDLVPPVALPDPAHRFWTDGKASAFLDELFDRFFQGLGIRNIMRKADYDRIARIVPRERIAPEVYEVLDALTAVAANARPEGAAP